MIIFWDIQNGIEEKQTKMGEYIIVPCNKGTNFVRSLVDYGLHHISGG